MHSHWLSVLSILSAVLLAELARPPAPLWGDIRVMHTWNTAPANWESLGPPPADTTIDLYIALAPQRKNALIDALYEVSDPKHPKYGLHLSKEQVAELVAPHQDTLEIVHSWLEHHGVPPSSISTSHGGGWLTVAGVPVSQADELLGASYQLYRHTGTNETGAILRTVGYSLPAALHGHVETVAPTTHFASPRTAVQTPRKVFSKEAVIVNATSEELVRVLSKRNGYVTPAFLRWLYRTEAYVPAGMSQNALGTSSFMHDYASQEDLAQFMTEFRSNAEAGTLAIVQINGGGYDTSRPGVGGSISTQYAEAMAHPTPHIFYSVGGALQWAFKGEPLPGDAYLEWLRYLLSHDAIPQTITMSFANPEQEFPRAYALRLCDLFALIGARGTTVIVTSGDDGVGIGDCKYYRRGLRFMPMFPASCPSVTSVGGTTGYDPEVAAAFSGGGFSDYFKRPPYQEEAVPPYLNFIKNAHYQLFRRGGRGIPDISSQAQDFVYIRNTILYSSSGTVCSASTAAGIFALLNDYLLSTDRAPLGFLNPWLYSHGLLSSNDITRGSNPGCNTNGFSATTGWDPVTGLGTLDFEILQAAVDHEIDDSDSDSG